MDSDVLLEYRKRHALMYQKRLEEQERAAKEAQEQRELEARLARERQEKIEKCADDQCASIHEAVASIEDGSDPSMVSLKMTELLSSLEGAKELWGSDDGAVSRIKEAVMLLFDSAGQVRIQFNDAAQVEASKSIRAHMRDLLVCCGVLGEADEELDLEFDMDCSRDEEIARQLAAQMEQEAYGFGADPFMNPVAFDPPPAQPVLDLRQPRRRQRRAAQSPAVVSEDPQPPVPQTRQRRRRTARATEPDAVQLP